MRHVRLVVCWVVGSVGASVAAQPPPSTPAKIAAMEQQVARLSEEVTVLTAALRAHYRTIDEALVKARNDDDGARLRADLQRVLEPLMKEVGSLAQQPGSRNEAKAKDALRKGLPGALQNLEIVPLPDLVPYLEKRFRDLQDQATQVRAFVETPLEALSDSLLTEVYDLSVPFYERWNTCLAPELTSSARYRNTVAALEKARQELMIAKDPLLYWQIGCPEGFAKVPAGRYVIRCTGGFNQSRKKEQAVTLPEFLMGLREVTHQEYLAWLRTLPPEEREPHEPRNAERQHLWELNTETGERTPDAEHLSHPVVGVNLASAVAYATFVGCRIPSEAEWSAAAAGPKGLPFPWGPKYEPDRCWDRSAAEGTHPVGSLPAGRGPFGHFDLAGNASEWCLTDQDGKALDPAAIPDRSNAIVRGGSFRESPQDMDTGWVWIRAALYDRDITTGFRLVRDP